MQIGGAEEKGLTVAVAVAVGDRSRPPYQMHFKNLEEKFKKNNIGSR